MGFFDKYKADNAGRKAYGLHVMGNRLYDQDKTAEAKAKHEQALKLYEEAIKGGCTKPAYVMAYGVLLLRFAICQWKLGQIDSAISNLKIAMSEAPTGMLYGSLGYVLIEKARQTGDFAEALEFNTKALDYDDEDAVVLDNLGQLYLAMGDKDKALEYFQKAHEIKPRQVDTLYYLARLAAEKGENKQAIDYLSSALDGNYSALCTTTRQQALDLKAELEKKG